MEQIILYSNNCPRCKVLENMLKSKKICFTLVTDFDIEEMQQRGFSTTPILKVNDSFKKFDEALAWVKEYKSC